MDAKTKKAQQAAKSAYVRRNETTDPYWDTVMALLRGRKFPLGSQTYEEFIKRMVRDKVSPDNVIEYSQFYGLQAYWKDLAAAGITNVSEWLLAYGLDENQNFYGGDSPKDFVEQVVEWSNEGYSASQVKAWRSIGLTPEQVEDKDKPVIIILD